MSMVGVMFGQKTLKVFRLSMFLRTERKFCPEYILKNVAYQKIAPPANQRGNSTMGQITIFPLTNNQ